MAGKPVTLVLFEALIIGLFVVLFGHLTSFLLKIFESGPMLPEICKDWNRYYIMERTLFLVGFLLHLTFEYAGINKEYAKAYPITV